MYKLTATLSLATTLLAQPPQLAPDALELVTFRADRIDELCAAFPRTRLGRLLADPDVAPAADACGDHLRRWIDRRNAIAHAVRTTETGLEGWDLAAFLRTSEGDFWRLAEHPVDELRAASLRFVFRGDATRRNPEMLISLHPTPRHEGRWVQQLQQQVAELQTSPYYDEVPEAKLDGFPVHCFAAKNTSIDESMLRYYSFDRWLMHIPGTIAFGPGKPDALITTESTATADQPSVRFRMDLAGFRAEFERQGRTPRGFTELGFGTIDWLEWRARIVDDLILDEGAAELSGELDALAKGILGGTAKPPRQPMPDGALLQVRGSIDVATMIASVGEIEREPLPAHLHELAVQTFDGGYALGITAPAPGGVIPRIFVSAGLRDADALPRLIAALIGTNDELEVETREYDSVSCSVLQLVGMPQGIQPAWCVLDGTLHVAESARSLRAFLKARANGSTGMDPGDSPVAEGPGEIVDNLSFCFDTARLYECYYEHWLPLFELANSRRGGPIARDDLPEPELVAEYLSRSQGVLRKDGGLYTLQCLGSVGGPEMAAMLMTWGPMLASEVLRDYRISRAEDGITQHRLQAIGEALQRFHKREQRWPNDLAEFARAEKLAKDALFVPGDDLAETFAMPDGSERRSSFRLVPQEVEARTQQGEAKFVLIEIRHGSNGRFGVDTEGDVRQLMQGATPIDELMGSRR